MKPNGETLKWARERMGLELRDVERIAKYLLGCEITAEELNDWEQEAAVPTKQELGALAIIYDCSQVTLCQPPPTDVIPHEQGQ